MWNLKYGTNEPIYEMETESWEQRTDLWLPWWGGGAQDGWEFGVNRYKLLHIEWINNKVLLYSSGNYILSPGINHNGK